MQETAQIFASKIPPAKKVVSADLYFLGISPGGHVEMRVERPRLAGGEKERKCTSLLYYRQRRGSSSCVIRQTHIWGHFGPRRGANCLCNTATTTTATSNATASNFKFACEGEIRLSLSLPFCARVFQSVCFPPF